MLPCQLIDCLLALLLAHLVQRRASTLFVPESLHDVVDVASDLACHRLEVHVLLYSYPLCICLLVEKEIGRRLYTVNPVDLLL